jgi:hypothetical protein
LQPFSVRADSPQHELATRLLGFLRSKQAHFQEAGFRWRDDQPIKSSEIKVPAWLVADDAGQ